MNKLLIFTCLFLIKTMSYSQSAWVKEKGEVYSQIAYNDISNYKSVFNKNGKDLFTSRVISDRTVQLYGEYGLTNKFTIVGAIPIKMLKTGEEVSEYGFSPTIKEGNLTALGNVDLGVRYLLSQKKVNLTTQLQIGLPTSSYDGEIGLRSGINSWVVNPSLSIGKGSRNWFLQGSAGLLLRTNNYSNGAKLYAEGGWKFFNHFWVIAFVDVVDSFEDGSLVESKQNLETFLNLNNSEYKGYGMKFIGEISNNVGLTAAFGGAFSAHLEAKKASYNLGIYYKFKKAKKNKE